MPNNQYPMKFFPALIFSSRWLQLPLYLGLIAAQGVRRVAAVSGLAMCGLLALLLQGQGLAALLPEPDAYWAYTVPPVSRVTAIRGVPPMVLTTTFSLKLTVKSRFWPTM